MVPIKLSNLLYDFSQFEIPQVIWKSSSPEWTCRIWLNIWLKRRQANKHKPQLHLDAMFSIFHHIMYQFTCTWSGVLHSGFLLGCWSTCSSRAYYTTAFSLVVEEGQLSYLDVHGQSSSVRGKWRWLEMVGWNRSAKSSRKALSLQYGFELSFRESQLKLLIFSKVRVFSFSTS